MPPITEQTGRPLRAVPGVRNPPGGGLRKDDFSGRYRLNQAAPVDAAPRVSPPVYGTGRHAGNPASTQLQARRARRSGNSGPPDQCAPAGVCAPPGAKSGAVSGPVRGRGGAQRQGRRRRERLPLGPLARHLRSHPRHLAVRSGWLRSRARHAQHRRWLSPGPACSSSSAADPSKLELADASTSAPTLRATGQNHWHHAG
jgi:hypothetical protein